MPTEQQLAEEIGELKNRLKKYEIKEMLDAVGFPGAARTEFFMDQLNNAKDAEARKTLIQEMKRLIDVNKEVTGMGDEFDPDGQGERTESSREKVIEAAKSEHAKK